MPKAKGTPIVFTLYGDDDEVLGTYSRSIITTRFLERAIDMADELENGTTKEVLHSLDQLIVDFYGERFTLEQVMDGGDIAEKLTILEAILAKAGNTIGGEKDGTQINADNADKTELGGAENNKDPLD